MRGEQVSRLLDLAGPRRGPHPSKHGHVLAQSRYHFGIRWKPDLVRRLRTREAAQRRAPRSGGVTQPAQNIDH
jgi:hypothetical protein